MSITFDNEKLQKIMNNFYILTKIRIVMFDEGFNKIMSVPNDDCGFCGVLKKTANLINCANHAITTYVLYA